MTPAGDRYCTSCETHTGGDQVCANCGRFRGKRAGPELMVSVAIGVFSGAFFAVLIFIAWGSMNYLGLGAASQLVKHSSPLCTTAYEFGVYASLGARVYEAAEVVVAALVGFAAIRWSIREAKNGHVSGAIAINTIVLLGLVPATVCDASILYTTC